MKQLDVEIPKKLLFLFEKARYKVAYGGRGSGKSWSFARALIAMAASKKTRVLCAREIQNSIRQSVHALLTDQIKMMGLVDYFEVLETEIRCQNGSVFNFSGLSNLTAASIKSFEGYDIVWVEEAQTVSKKSWQILIPTIRKPGSEIWVSFNPELDTDDTYVRFVVNQPPDSIVEQVNYNDNPYFGEELEQERLHCKETEPEDYENIWLGRCKAAVSGAIYAREVEAAIRDGRVTTLPYDPRLKVHTIWDLGWNDSMSIILAQRLRSEIRIIKYIEDSHKTLDWYVGELQNLRYNWGIDFLPHDGDHKDFKTGKSAKQILQKFGRNVRITPNIDRESGIRSARMTFGQCVFNRTETERLLECLRRYRRKVNVTTEETGSPVHDKFSHGADCFRYLALVADQMHNEDEFIVPEHKYNISVPGMGY